MATNLDPFVTGTMRNGVTLSTLPAAQWHNLARPLSAFEDPKLSLLTYANCDRSLVNPNPFSDPLQMYFPPRRRFEVMMGEQNVIRFLRVKQTVIAPSMIPALQGQRNSLGLFVPPGEVYKEGSCLAAYLGPIEDMHYARKLWKAGYGSHIQNVGTDRPYLINGAVYGPDSFMPSSEKVQWTLTDYITNGGVANFINHYEGSGQTEPNCEQIVLPAFNVTLPHSASGAQVPVSSVLFFRAKRDLYPGEEILRDVGQLHVKTYIATQSFRSDFIHVEPYPSRVSPEEIRRAEEEEEKAAAEAAAAAERLPRDPQEARLAARTREVENIIFEAIGMGFLNDTGIGA